MAAGGGGGRGRRGGPDPPPTATKTGTVLVNGQPFTGGTIPFNAVVDVTNGTVTLTADTGKLKVYGAGQEDHGQVQARPRHRQGQADRRAPAAGRQLQRLPEAQDEQRVRATKPKIVRAVWGDGKGKFRTKGRYSSATVRGTNWLTADRCDGTLTKVKRGVVEVRDIKKKQTVRVPAGRSTSPPARARR